jgi:hypothetical protein
MQHIRRGSYVVSVNNAADPAAVGDVNVDAVMSARVRASDVERHRAGEPAADVICLLSSVLD